MQDYKKLKVWNRSHLLVLDLYNIVNLFLKKNNSAWFLRSKEQLLLYQQIL